MEAACEAGGGTRCYGANLRFHGLGLQLGRKQPAHHPSDDFVKELHLFRRRDCDTKSNMQRQNIEHRQVVEAIAAAAAAHARMPAFSHVL